MKYSEYSELHGTVSGALVLGVYIVGQIIHVEGPHFSAGSYVKVLDVFSW
jgi:hypothetical protein